MVLSLKQLEYQGSELWKVARRRKITPRCSLVSQYPAAQVCGVLSNGALWSGFSEQSKTLAIDCFVWGTLGLSAQIAYQRAILHVTIRFLFDDIIIYLLFIYIFILHSNHNLLQVPSPPLLYLPTPYTPLPFLFRKWQISHGYWQKMAYQAIVRISAYPSIKAGQATQYDEQVPKIQ